MAICVIPAKGTSTRIPGKNMKLFRGKPILQYSIDLANNSGLFEAIYISTDDKNIYDFSHQKNITPKYRSENLSKDAGTTEVTADILHKLSPKYIKDETMVCCLYATSPLLDMASLYWGLKLLEQSDGANYSFSIGRNPLRDAGNFYWGCAAAFMAGIDPHGPMSIMIPIPDDRVCDINTPEDWIKAEEMYDKLHP